MNARVFWQSGVVAVVGCLAGGVALSQEAVDCSTVAEDRARLKCYDEQAALRKKAAVPPATAAAAAPPTARAPAVSSAPASAPPPGTASVAASPPAPAAASAAATPPVASPAATTPAPAASGSSDFGLSPETVRRRHATNNPDAPKTADQLVARVKAVTTKPRGEYRITLEDGQVWEETQHSSSTLPPDVGETITIKRGLLGSYFLSHSVGLALRVRRIN